MSTAYFIKAENNIVNNTSRECSQLRAELNSPPGTKQSLMSSLHIPQDSTPQLCTFIAR
jgi:hypothetical protein